MNSPGDNRSPVRKTKRLSISNINPEFDTHMANLQITQKPTFTQQLASRIRETAYSNSSSGPATQNMGHFTIQMDDHFRTSTTSQDPDVVYKEAMRCFGDIVKLFPKTENFTKIQTKDLEEELARFIFGSNAIEKAGTGEDVDVERVDERDPDYQDELDFCLEVDRNLDARASIIRGRYEIVQHAKAAKYLLDALVLRNQPLTEEVICETHRILLQHTEHQNEAGVYRTSDVGATGNAELSIESDDEWAKRKETIRKMKGLPFGAEVAVDRIVKPKFAAKFMRPGSIRPHMASLVKSFNEDMEHTSQAGTIDPVTIASRYCHHFVNVHPFIDGNGRMCRLLLNTILLKFTGVCISVGVEAKEREDWTMLSWRGNKDWIKEDLNDVPLRKQKSYVELTQLVLKKVQQRLGTFKKSMG